MLNNIKRRLFGLIFARHGLPFRFVVAVVNRLLGVEQPVVVASTGRAGSTVLTNAIQDCLIASRFPNISDMRIKFLKYFTRIFLSNLSDLNSNCVAVIKTHDLFDQKYLGLAKFIFIFGDPIESIESAIQMEEIHGREWMERHIAYLKGSGNRRDITKDDVLNYEKQIRAWSACPDVLLIHYDDLWGSEARIARFLDLDRFQLPVKRSRSKKVGCLNISAELAFRLKNIEASAREISNI